MTDTPFWADTAEHAGPFFRVLHTTRRSQCAVMTIAPGDEAGAPEVHADADQVFFIVHGEGEFRIWHGDDEPRPRRAGPGTLVVVPAGDKHWVKSIGREPLFFLSVYAPPEY